MLDYPPLRHLGIYHHLEIQARLLERFLQGELDDYPNFTPR